MNLTAAFLFAGATEGGAPVGWITTILYFALIIGMMWFLMIRPQKKREKEISAMQSAIKVGDSVLTVGGLFGKVVDVGTDVFVVEFGLNKGVRIPVQKDRIASVKEPNMSIKKADEPIKEEAVQK